MMRNFSAADKLMNRTLVIVVAVHPRHVVVDTLDGRRYPLPKICFKIELARGAGSMIRVQFSLRMAYTGTFHSAQGVTLNRCAVDVRKAPFMHGQLYTALARVRTRDALRIPAAEEQCGEDGAALVRNIVWRELLLPSPDTVRKRPASADQPAIAKRPSMKRPARA